jgi:hypothetical protein
VKLNARYVSIGDFDDLYFQVSFENQHPAADYDPSGPTEPYLLLQRQFEDDDGGVCYLETHDTDRFAGHFRLRLIEFTPTRLAFEIDRPEDLTELVLVALGGADDEAADDEGEARIGAHQDAHLGPAAANLDNDARHRLDRAVRRIQARAPQLGIQQMASAEHVKRQIAVAVVIAVEEPALLLAVHRIVGGVEIENDLARRLFLDETRDVLRAGLANAAWITVDDTGARHKAANGFCTQMGNAQFAWSGTTGSKSRGNFLELLRAGHGDYVVNAKAQPAIVPAPRASPGATDPHDRFTSGKIPANCDRPRQG